MGDTKMNDDDNLIDYNDVDPEDLIAGKTYNAPNKGGGNPNAVDSNFDAEQKVLSRSGDAIF
jgi:hypothetical protein